MRTALLIARRELAAYVKSPMGYVIAAIVLAIEGILFNAYALGGGQRLSAEVLSRFFYFSSGTTMIAAVLLSMRLLAEERQSGTMVVLRTAPVTEWQVIFGKYLSAMAFLTAMTLASVYLPLLILVRGRISVGHLAVGYAGLLMLGSASLAIGIFGSSLARRQVVAAVVSTAILVGLLVAWWLAKVTSPPFSGFFSALALHNRHFIPFMGGTFHSRDVVYYGSMTYLFLLAAVRVEGARRWS